MSAKRIASLAASRETPFYLYDPSAAASAIRRWKSAAGRRVRVFYPYKCNRFPPFLDRLAAEGLGAEINIGADLSGALARGNTGRRLIFQGPAKAPASVDRVIAVGGMLVADGEEDARLIVARARVLGRDPLYMLRLRAPQAREGQRAFGMSPEGLVRLATGAVRRGARPPVGLAFHLGTGIPSLAPYRNAIAMAGEIVRSLAAGGVSISVIDAGGGFSSPGESRFDDRGRAPVSPWTDPPAIVRALEREVERRIGAVELWIEPGRALAAEAFSFVTRVVQVRFDRTVFVDGSRMAHAFFVARGVHPLTAIPSRRGKRGTFAIAGPLGTDLDVLVRRTVGVAPLVGDLVVFGAVGAYNLIAANEWAGPVPPVVEMGKTPRRTR